MSMTRKQLKRAAETIADLEFIIQSSSDPLRIEKAKAIMLKTSESLDLGLDDIVKLDSLIAEILKEKKI